MFIVKNQLRTFVDSAGRSGASRNRARTQKGSAMLEGALVMLPLLAIGFALLDFPLGIFIQNTLRNAVREGVRYAITQQTGGSGQDAAITTVVENNSMGFLNASDISAGTSTITISYYNKATQAASAGVGSNGAGNICVVTATIQRKWMAPLLRGTGLLSFSAASADVMEAPPNGVLPGRRLHFLTRSAVTALSYSGANQHLSIGVIGAVGKPWVQVACEAAHNEPL